MTDIFISYAKEDRERVRSLVAVFERQGLSVWWDREIAAGRDFRDVIDQEIRAARCMVVVWSKHANASKWVRDEADEGQRRGLLIPVLFDNVLPPMGFRGIQAADLTQWQGDPDDATIKQLLDDVAPVVQRTAQASPGDEHEPRIEPEPARPPDATPPWDQPQRPSAIPRDWWKTTSARWIGIAAVALLVIVWILTRPTGSVPREPVPTKPTEGAAVVPNPAPAATSSPTAPLPAPVPAEPPPGEYFVLPAVGKQPDTQLRLVKADERRNQITDDDDWWVANRLQRPTYTVPNPFRQVTGDLPASVPPRYQNRMVVKVIRGTPLLAIYGENFSEGRYLLAIDPASGHSRFSFDFSLYEWPPSFVRADKEFVQMATEWAQVEHDILYVAHAHSTYAHSSNGYNAFITAIDVPSNRILWRSQPLVNNAGNFVIKDDAIIAGYGFSGEKDYLYVLNKGDGRVVQQIAVRSGPSNLIERDNRLYARTYDTDYVFEFTSAPVMGR
jgi:hypothetical protein